MILQITDNASDFNLRALQDEIQRITLCEVFQ